MLKNTPPQLLKQCLLCRKTFPATPEYFRVLKKTGALWSPCKECVAKRVRKKKEDPEYYKAKKEQDRKWRGKNRVKRNTARRERYLTDPDYKERRKLSSQKSKSTPESKEKQKRYHNTLEQRYATYIKGAKLRNLEFNLSLEEFRNFWNEPCLYCGAEIKTIGLDRVNSDKGYFLDNVVPCCAKCNRAKAKSSPTEWVAFIRAVSGRLQIIETCYLKLQQPLPSHNAEVIASQGST